jgi:hypothetical protein
LSHFRENLFGRFPILEEVVRRNRQARNSGVVSRKALDAL